MTLPTIGSREAITKITQFPAGIGPERSAGRCPCRNPITLKGILLVYVFAINFDADGVRSIGPWLNFLRNNALLNATGRLSPLAQFYSLIAIGDETRSRRNLSTNTVAVFVLLQTTTGRFRVYGFSMLPTIRDGDYIIVDKAAYYFSSPRRGDVIALESPCNNGTDLIKRIIALPGDTIKINNGTVFVNNTPLIEPYIFEKPQYSLSPQQIPPDNYFVLGDNRSNSDDSHAGWTLPREEIVGKAWVAYWPPTAWRAIPRNAIYAGK